MRTENHTRARASQTLACTVRDLPWEMSERGGNQAHLQVLASVNACFCQKRKQVSFAAHRAQISAEYSAEAALWLTPPKGVTWPRCWAFGQGCGTRGQSLWTITGVSLPADRNIPVWFQGLSVHTPLLTWSCYCKEQKFNSHVYLRAGQSLRTVTTGVPLAERIQRRLQHLE